MRDWHFATFAVLLLGSINLWGWLGTQKPPKPTFEYKVSAYPDDDMPYALNADAKDGWRAVSCRRAIDEVSAKTVVSDRVTRALYECLMERPR